MNLDEKIPLAGQVSKQLVRDGGEEVADIRWCGPALCAVVDHDGEKGRVLAAGAQILVVESQEDSDGVVHHAERHAAVDGGLEFEQDQQVEPFVVERSDAPEHVGEALAQPFADEACREAFQGGEVEVTGEVVGSGA